MAKIIIKNDIFEDKTESGQKLAHTLLNQITNNFKN